MPNDLPLSPDQWRVLDKAFSDYLLVDRAHQSTQSRFDDLDDVGWSPIQDGQLLLRTAVDNLSDLKTAAWKFLGRSLDCDRLHQWADGVTGMSSEQVALISGSYATCFLPSGDEEPMGVPNVRSAWAYHGLDVNGDGEAPSYQSGQASYFDRDLKAKLIHRVGGMVYRHDNYYSDVYYDRKEQKKNDPSWDDEPDAHFHADALRIVTKEIIKDWWRVLHGQRSHAFLDREAVA